nr:hypothetical protein [Tanacetum cinerariifolium]
VAAVTAERPRRQRKKRPAVTNASASSHTPVKLRGDYGTSSGAATGGKSMFVLKELLASSILNVKGGNPTDSITGLNLRTIGASKRYVVLPLVITEAVVTFYAISDPSIPVPEMGTKITSSVHASMLHDSNSTDIVRTDVAGTSYSAKQDI